ncbi:acyltransferase family protein [Bacillus sp. REN16]|uniref:acyltransferase family protein n=1 Tax=Bacillus sp. REN16 TaxID=2887296 RepID=UPI001E609ED9|nr:acyltransferase family protein [Bacillus sp. REN16]MCC3359622.1 acyltransferase family protein [Bacillus sp. REN16]
MDPSVPIERRYILNTKRKLWLDIAKGIGIISVVIGHAGIESLSPYFYWFHMPLFFLISGYLYKRTNHFVTRKTKSLLIPYVSFFVLLSVLQFYTFGISDFNIHYEYFLKGGRYLKGTFGVLWFITSLYVLSVIFHMLILLNSKIVLFIVAITFYFLSYYDSIHFNDVFVIWDINTILFTFVFYYIGYLYKEYESKISHLISKAAFPSALLIIVLIFLNIRGLFVYKLDIKNQVYNHLFIDIGVPLLFVIFVFWISNKLEVVKGLNKTLSIIGESSLTIMYLHIFLLTLFATYTHMDTWLIIFMSIIIPTIIHQLFKASRITSLIFLGIQSKQKPPIT